MSSKADLTLQSVLLRPGGDWPMQSGCWRLLHVEAGMGYWMSHIHSQYLSQGDTLLMAPAASGAVLASRLGEMRFQFFTINQEILSSLFTLSERQSLDSIGGDSASAIRYLSGAHTVASDFAALKSAGGWEFVTRCRLLQIFGSVLPEDLVPIRPGLIRYVKLQDRIQQLFQQLKENEILTCSPEELARQCGCSLRHFRRLFRVHFGCSIRDKQIALRLEKARSLLETTDETIVSVGLQCGYQSVGIFNGAFKKKLGVTPSEWREKSRNKA